MAEISPISPSKNEESEQLHSQNQSISPELMEKLVHKALVWCSLHGLVVGDKHNQRSGKFPGVGIVHAPFALLPTPLARNQFLQACELTPIFNELVDRVSLDSEFLQDSLSRTKKVDAFTSRLLDIHSKMLEIGKKEDVRLGLHRSDYMLDAQSKGLLQIELHRISCSFPGLSCLVSELHRCGAQATKGEMRGSASVDGEAITPAEHVEEDSFDWENLNATEQKENDCYIHRVPAKLRNIDASRYEPSTVSIGPYHADKILEVSRAHKKSFMRSLVARSGTPAADLRRMESRVTEKQDEARKYYAETVMLSDKDFIKMLVLDGCFILELFYKSLEPKKRRVADRLYSKKWTHSSLRRDMVLLENQIPYFVLTELFEIAPTGMKVWFGVLL